MRATIAQFRASLNVMRRSGASEIIAYPPGIAGVSPASRVAGKIGREARQISWIHPICRACHLPKLKCSIIPLCIGQTNPTPVSEDLLGWPFHQGLPPKNLQMHALAACRQRQPPSTPKNVSFRIVIKGGVKRTKRTFLQEFSWNPPPDSPLTQQFPRHHPKSGAHTNSLPAPQNEISSPAFGSIRISYLAGGRVLICWQMRLRFSHNPSPCPESHNSDNDCAKILDAPRMCSLIGSPGARQYQFVCACSIVL